MKIIDLVANTFFCNHPIAVFIFACTVIAILIFIALAIVCFYLAFKFAYSEVEAEYKTERDNLAETTLTLMNERKEIDKEKRHLKNGR